MSLDTFRAALGSKLGEVVTPELAAWLEGNAFDRVDNSHNPSKFKPGGYKLGTTFAVELIADIKNDLHILHAMHWAETERHQQSEMNPDYDGFIARERAGQLIQFTVRDWGRLVGHVRMYVYKSMHTQKSEAKEDVFYLRPEARRGFKAIRLWQYVEACLKQIGVTAITTDSKLVNKVGRLNEYLGYQHVGNIYFKSLE